VKETGDKIYFSHDSMGLHKYVLQYSDCGLRTCDDFGLSKHHFLCDASLPLIQLLTNAGNHTKTVLQSMSRLLTNKLTEKTSPSVTSSFLMSQVQIQYTGKSFRVTSSLSPKTWRLSECPRITHFTPQSLIIAGLEAEVRMNTNES